MNTVVVMAPIEEYQYSILSQAMLCSVPIETPSAYSPGYPWDYLSVLCSWARSHRWAICWLVEEGLTIQLSPPSCPLQNLGAKMVPWLSLHCWQFGFNLVWTWVPCLPAALKHWPTLSGSAWVSQEAYSERFPGTKGTVTWELAPALHPHGFSAGGTADGDRCSQGHGNRAGAAGRKSQGSSSE